MTAINSDSDKPGGLSFIDWTALLRRFIVRLSPLNECGELRLVAAILAAAITNNFKDALRYDIDPLVDSFFDRGFVRYCMIIGVDHEQIKDAASQSFLLVTV